MFDVCRESISPVRSERFQQSLRKTLKGFINLTPVILGMLLLTSLVLTFMPETFTRQMFGHGDLPDALVGAVLGGVSMGHPLASYILGGELLSGGVSLLAVTAILVSWVTVGVVQLPAEALVLGWRFAAWRNLLALIGAVLLAFLVVGTLAWLGLA